MRKYYFIISIILICLLSAKFTHSYFTDNASSATNTFAAASEFGRVTPTSTPSPTVTLTPTPSISTEPTPGQQIAAGDVVINEIMWMGTQGNAADEWIELRNMTSNIIDLSGWVIENLGSGVSSNVVLPIGKTIAPNGFFLIANDTKETGAHNIDPDHIINVSLLNPSETLTLRIATAGAVIDIADNSDNGWFAGATGGGQDPERSMERNLVPGEGTVSTNWHTATTAVNMDADTREIATPRAASGL